MNDPRNLNSNVFFTLKNSEDKIKFLLHYAILAPSTHNSQPWLFKISKGICSFYYNPELLLPEADKIKRNLYISMGACVENFMLAAEYFALQPKLVVHCNEKTRLVAEVRVKDNISKDKMSEGYAYLIDAITQRINTRGIFQSRKIPARALETFSKIAKSDAYSNKLELNIITDNEDREKLARLTAEGLKMAYKSSSFRREMSGWINHNFSRKKQGIPGYSMKMPNLLSLLLPKIIPWFNIGSILSGLNYRSLVSAPAIVIVSAKEESPESWFAVGRLSERLMLECTAQGIKNSIFVAAIEMGNVKEVQAITKSTMKPQFLLVAGYMDQQQAPTPRHELAKKILL